MFDKLKLKGKIIEKGFSISELSNAIGVSETTFYRKMDRNGDFSRFEIKAITEKLKLNENERDDLFFT